jgi:putative N-acetyltransferase (TIGR04045 family)
MPPTSSPSSLRPSPPRVEPACHLARSPRELAAHFALRRLVFVGEQRLFAADDRDARDDEPDTLHVVGLLGTTVCGAVRLYPVDESGLWKGDRLAVVPEHRASHLGAALVRFAVRTAGGRGGRRMIAHIQPPNVAFFERLGWRPEGRPEPFHGLDHQLMTTALTRDSAS